MAFFWTFINAILELIGTSLFMAFFSVIFVVVAVCWTFNILREVLKT